MNKETRMLCHSYKMNINGLEIEVGRLTIADSFGVFLDFKNESIRKAISDSNSVLIDAIKKILLISEELEAVNTFTDFENFYLQGHSWSSLSKFLSIQKLTKLFEQAKLVLESEYSNDAQKQSAISLINNVSQYFV